MITLPGERAGFSSHQNPANAKRKIAGRRLIKYALFPGLNEWCLARVVAGLLITAM